MHCTFTQIGIGFV